jgi:hypothetical protein
LESLARTRRQYPKYLTEIHALASSVCLHLLPLGQPPQGGTFVSGPASEVEHHTGVHSEKLKSEADHQSFEYDPLAIGLRLTKQREHTLVRSQAQCVLLARKFLGNRGFPGSRKAHHQDHRRHVSILAHKGDRVEIDLDLTYEDLAVPQRLRRAPPNYFALKKSRRVER